MTVGELIYKLNKLDINAEVYVHDKEGVMRPAGTVDQEDETMVDIIP